MAGDYITRQWGSSGVFLRAVHSIIGRLSVRASCHPKSPFLSCVLCFSFLRAYAFFFAYAASNWIGRKKQPAAFFR